MRKGFTLIELMIVIAIIAIIAAIAIPNLLESRVTANEAAASATMKAGIFPAQTQFQGGSYQDADLDSRGEYGTIEAMAGVIVTTKAPVGQLRLITGPLSSAAALAAAGVRQANGYSFRAFVPGQDSNPAATLTDTTDEGEIMPVALAANVATGSEFNSAESFFVVGAMPERFSDTGRKVYVMCQDGQIRSPSQPANINRWFTGGAAPVNGAASTPALVSTGVGDFLTNTAQLVSACTDPDNWSTPFGSTRQAGAVETYPTVSK